MRETENGMVRGAEFEETDALSMDGFDDAMEVSLGADATAYYEAQEAKEVAREGGHMTTSCCPAFYNMVMKHYPQLADKVSHTVSPMVATARFIKKNHPGAKVAFIGPCVAKKSEVKRYKKMNSEGADFALTYEELQAMFAAKSGSSTRFSPASRSRSRTSSASCGSISSPTS